MSSSPTPGNGRINLDTFLRVGQMLFAMTLPVVGWMFAVVQDHEVRVVRIESSRFSAADARQMEDRLRVTFPPDWLREDLVDLKDGIKQLNTRLSVIEREVKK